MESKTIISWDLGGTKCAAGVIHYSNAQHYNCIRKCHINLKECKSLDDLIEKIDRQLDFDSAQADAICIGGAGQFDGHDLILQNGYPFAMDFGRAQHQHDWPIYTVIHDYSSVACATFTSYMLNDNNVKILQEGEFDPYGRRVTLGIGTGLGLKDSILFPNGNFWLGTNEAGHIGITHPPLCSDADLQRHNDLIKFLRSENILRTNDPLTFETILTGQGIVNIYEFLYGKNSALTPETIGQQLSQGQARECLQIMAWYLGLFIGTVQLIFMPSGGIWVTGGVILKNLNVFDLPDFNKGINASPCYQQQREKFPLGVLCNPEHALVGCAYYAVNRLL